MKKTVVYLVFMMAVVLAPSAAMAEAVTGATDSELLPKTTRTVSDVVADEDVSTGRKCSYSGANMLEGIARAFLCDDEHGDVSEEERQAAIIMMTVFIVGILLFMSIPMWGSLILMRFLRKRSRARQKKGLVQLGAGSGLDLGIGSTPLPHLKDAPYERKAPSTDELFVSYWICYRYHLMKDQTGIVGALILKWIREKKITATEKHGRFSHNYVLDISELRHGEDELENMLITMLKEASGSNQLLETHEFERWSRWHKRRVKAWYDRIEMTVIVQLAKSGLLTAAAAGHNGMAVSYRATPELVERATRILGLKHYLQDFSTIHERGVVDIDMWGGYLIYAQLLDISLKVDKQFSGVLPNFDFSSARAKISFWAVLGVMILLYITNVFGLIIVIVYYRTRYER